MLTARPASDCREDRAGIQLSGIARQAGSPSFCFTRPPDSRPFPLYEFHAFLLLSLRPFPPHYFVVWRAPCVTSRTSTKLPIPTKRLAKQWKRVNARKRSTHTPRIRERWMERECSACAVHQSRHAVAPKRIFSRFSYWCTTRLHSRRTDWVSREYRTSRTWRMNEAASR